MRRTGTDEQVNKARGPDQAVRGGREPWRRGRDRGAVRGGGGNGLPAGRPDRRPGRHSGPVGAGAGPGAALRVGGPAAHAGQRGHRADRDRGQGRRGRAGPGCAPAAGWQLAAATGSAGVHATGGMMRRGGARPLGIGVALGDVAAAGWGGPVHDPWAGLFETPALGLFTSVVATAEGGQVALAGTAALIVGGGVVEVAAGGGPLAAGGGAGQVAGLDQVPKSPAGLVARLLVAVVAGAVGQGGDAEGETVGGELGQTAGAGQAAVTDGPVVGTGDRDAEAGGGVGKPERDQGAGRRRVHGPEPADRAGISG